MFDLSSSYRVIILTGNKAENKDTGSSRWIDSEGKDEITHFKVFLASVN